MVLAFVLIFNLNSKLQVHGSANYKYIPLNTDLEDSNIQFHIISRKQGMLTILKTDANKKE
jgi:hypothetical protein